jgi:hypothetical protein
MRFALAAVVAMIVILGAFVAANRRGVETPFGEELQLDDMAFSVVSYRTAPTLPGDGRVAPRNAAFHVVRLRAVNLAKRVDHRTGAIEPHLLDGEGRRYEVSEAGQAALDATREIRGWGDTLLRVGEAVEADWVFDAPAPLAGARIQVIVSRQALPGLVEDIVLGQRRLLLPEPELAAAK